MTNTAEKIELQAVESEMIHPSNMNQMQFAHQVWSVTTRDALTVEQLEDPATWAMCSSKLRLFDRVEVMHANGSQLSLGIVTYVGGNDVKVQIYAHIPLHEQAREEIEYHGFIVRWGGIDRNWIIVNADSGDTMRENFASDAAAIKYLKEHFQSLNIQQ